MISIAKKAQGQTIHSVRHGMQVFCSGHMFLISDLINEDRHADHGDPVVHGLQHAVHAAVRDEEEGAGVGQHRLLRHLGIGVCGTVEYC